jgi:hypothetical protein
MRLGSENRLDGIQHFGRFGFFQTVSDQSDGFPHRPSTKHNGIDYSKEQEQRHGKIC